MKKNKILIICPFVKPNLGGVESHIEKLTKQIIAKSYFPVIISYQPLTRRVRGIPHEIHRDHEIIRQAWFGNGLFNKFEPYFPIQFLYLFPGLFCRSLIYYLKHHREIVCIHAHGLVSAVITDFLKFFHPCRTVVSTHAIYHFSQKPILSFLVKAILKPFDKILAVSDVSLGELINLGLPASKLAVHPNWINSSIFKPISIKKNTTDFLFVGRLIEKKGIKIFLETAANTPQAFFHIVGDGPELLLVNKYTQEYNNIKFYGPLLFFNPDDLAKLVHLYNLADYLISPYLYDEGFSTVLLESLACGTPVIIPKRGSPPTFLSPNVYLPLSRNTSSAKLSKLLKIILKNKHQKISHKSCVEFAQTNFGLQNADIIINSYET